MPALKVRVRGGPGRLAVIEAAVKKIAVLKTDEIEAWLKGEWSLTINDGEWVTLGEPVDGGPFDASPQ